ncbi:MAG: hypothetical protein AAF196_16390 [Planctomycetota bacterium]
MDNTLRFVRAVASLPGVRLGIVSQEPVDRLPKDLRQEISAYAQVGDAMKSDSLVQGVRQIAGQWGQKVDSLLGILEPLQEPLAEARAKLGLPGTSPEAAGNMRDKAQMKDTLRQHGLPCARHGLGGSIPEILRAAEHTGFPLVAKPPDGAGAKRTVRCDSAAQLEDYLRNFPPNPSKPLLLEEFIQGDEFSFDSMSLNGKHVFHSISSYTPTPLEVVQTPWIQWCVLLPRSLDEFSDILDAGPRSLTALGMQTGMSHTEWFRRPDGTLAISEVAARPPGAQFMSLISYAHDTDMYRAWAALETFGQVEIGPRSYAVGAAYLRAQGQGRRVRGVSGIEKVKDELKELVVEAKLPKPGMPKSESYEGEGYVILRDEDTETVREGLQKLVSNIRVELG